MHTFLHNLRLLSCCCLAGLLFFPHTVRSQNVGIGTAAPQQRLDVEGWVELGDETMGTAGTAGAIRYNTGQFLEFYDGTAWQTVGSGGWQLTGNAGTTPATNFLGTTDAQDMVIRSNNNEWMRVYSGGGVGVNAPASVGPFVLQSLSGGTDVAALAFATGTADALQAQAGDPASFAINAINTDPDGTGVLATGNNQGGNFLLNGSGGAFTGGFSGVYAFNTDPDGHGIVARGENVGAITVSANGSAISAVSEETGIFVTSNNRGMNVNGAAGNVGIFSSSAGGGHIGVYGQASAGIAGGNAEIGVVGDGQGDPNTVGVFGFNPGAMAFFGDGDLNVTGAKNFYIDHPQDPANKTLRHFCHEGNEPLNVYSGKATTDASGLATVQLPDYFEALNKDYRYQLTVIGSMTRAVVWQEVQNNQFVIKTNAPNVKVSWEVTGVRNDAYMQQFKKPVVETKPASQQGRYLDPLSHGQPASKGILRTHTSEPGKTLQSQSVSPSSLRAPATPVQPLD